MAFPVPATGIPAPPPATLDPFLDAAERCFARHGISRTSVQDVARELRVDRTTVYRQVGNVDSQVRLLLARELHRILTRLPALVHDRKGPEMVVELLDDLITHFRTHPVLVKVLADEPELIGPFLASELPDVFGRVAAVVAPLLEAAMATGELAKRDPIVVAEYLVRIGVTLILAPPPGELRSFLAEILVPALAPGKQSL